MVTAGGRRAHLGSRFELYSAVRYNGCVLSLDKRKAVPGLTSASEPQSLPINCDGLRGNGDCNDGNTAHARRRRKWVHDFDEVLAMHVPASFAVRIFQRIYLFREMSRKIKTALQAAAEEAKKRKDLHEDSDEALVESEEEVNVAPSRKARKVSIGDVLLLRNPTRRATPPRKNR